MNIPCCMLLLFYLAGFALPNEMQAIPLQNLTHPNHHHAVQSSNQSFVQTNQTNHTLTYPRLTLLSSASKATKATPPTPSNNAPLRSAPTPAESKVEDYAKKLRADLEAQERTLHAYVATIQRKHASVEMNLKRVKGILKELKDEISNATAYANQYQAQETEQTKQSNLISGEYNKSLKMYETEKSNLKFEREFLDAIIRYIKLRKNAKC